MSELVFDPGARTGLGVWKHTRNGTVVVLCSRCAKVAGERTSAHIARFERGSVFLSPPHEGWGWEKSHGVYEARRSGRNGHRPVVGSRIRCRTCGFVITVPAEPER